MRQRGRTRSRPRVGSKASLLGWAWLPGSVEGRTPGPAQTALDGREVLTPPKETGVPLSTEENRRWETAKRAVCRQITSSQFCLPKVLFEHLFATVLDRVSILDYKIILRRQVHICSYFSHFKFN